MSTKPPFTAVEVRRAASGFYDGQIKAQITSATIMPLLGDPLYQSDQGLSATATPGDGGYHLHAWRLEGLRGPLIKQLTLCAQPPKRLRDQDDAER